MVQKLLNVYNRLDAPNGPDITPNREVKISIRIYVPHEILEAAFTEIHVSVTPQTTITGSTAQSQDSEPDLEASTGSYAAMLSPSNIASTTTMPSRRTGRHVDHPRGSRATNMYDLISIIVEQDKCRFEAGECRKQELHDIKVAKTRLELAQFSNSLHQDNNMFEQDDD